MNVIETAMDFQRPLSLVSALDVLALEVDALGWSSFSTAGRSSIPKDPALTRAPLRLAFLREREFPA